MDITEALEYHLTCNHYPPVPTSMVRACRQAIELAVGDEWDEPVTLPAGITYRGQSTAPVRVIVDAHHLDTFVDGFTYDDEWVTL